MKIVSIEYPSDLSNVKDITDDNIDVFVTLEDGVTYNVVVTTPKFMYSYMEKEGLEYYSPCPPEIIVRSLTEETIRKAIESYAEGNAYWLKLHYVSHRIKMEHIQEEIDEIVAYHREVDALSLLDDEENKEN